ncbi:MAG: transcription-repair coupling factor [Coxiella sp. DG_40]|nr:MAG: transcription-repair coupling factor [Coxiella sp. DG_40]
MINNNLPLKKGEQTYWSGLYGSSSSLAIYTAAVNHNGPVIVLAPDMLHVNKLANDLHFFAQQCNLDIMTLPDWETLPYDRFSPHQDIISQRLLTFYKLLSFKTGILLVSVTTAMHRFVPHDYIVNNSFVINKHDQIDISKLRDDLQKRSYYCVNQVMEHGEFAIRGSIIDVFPMGSLIPYRIDLFDNEIDSICEFDPETQRSLKELESINLLPAREISTSESAINHFRHKWQALFPKNVENCPFYQSITDGNSVPGIEYYLPMFFTQTETLFDYLPHDGLLIRTSDLHKVAQTFWTEINERYEQLRYDITHPILAPKDIFIPVDNLFGYFNNFSQIQITKESRKTKTIDFKSKELPDLTLDSKASQPLAKLQDFLNSTTARILFCAESTGRQQALLQLLKHIDVEPMIYPSWDKFLQGTASLGISIAQLDQGLWLKNVIIIPEAVIFGQQVMQRRLREQQQQDTEAVIRDLTELKIGDPVVHIEHGIGRYLGLQTISTAGQEAEYLTIEYANQAKLFVPISALHSISRYMGANPENVPYNDLGSKQWEKAKHKAQQKIYDVAAELLNIYAQRAAKIGFSFHKDDMQHQQFAGIFPFETTIDQQNAIDQVINDMASPRSMDRLICGDVGFGKTEVAMRAAFLAVENNKQVVILTPTTLLAQQHYHNFQDRFANWPVNIAMLSRFNSPKQQKAIIDHLKKGKIDIIIGTHRLLQRDIEFKDLGLLIVDEEHRFGVRQKEKIKSFRANVDILTLTATPIPRTLSMALSGIRDLSIIATPPAKRLSIKTFIQDYNKQLIREAILRETLRGGQVYFLHNDVATIENKARELRELIPESRIEIAHGQMPERQLEQIMGNFYHLRFNVLVCTTIIESGIDIPTANTIIINNADHFGLAQLHQLRGRVGRSHHQAYAYLFVRSQKSITRDAKKRLDAFATMEGLGAGFTLAIHDLEIRGAGEILGKEQSGQIQAIGFNLYTELLNRAVKALKSGKQPELTELFNYEGEIDLKIPALIPDNYVHNVNTRLTLYKRIANAKDNAELHELQVELVDRFGLLPQPVKNLFAITKIKLKARLLGIYSIKADIAHAVIEFDEKPNINSATIIELIQKYPETYKFYGKNKLKFTLREDNAENRIIKIEQLLKDISNLTKYRL